MINMSKVTAYSWCYLLEIELTLPSADLPVGVSWLGDVWRRDVSESSVPSVGAIVTEVRIGNEYTLSTKEDPSDEIGLFLLRESCRRAIDSVGSRVQRSLCTYVCWPLPAYDRVEVTVSWKAASIDATVGIVSGREINDASAKSRLLDEDLRPT